MSWEVIRPDHIFDDHSYDVRTNMEFLRTFSVIEDLSIRSNAVENQDDVMQKIIQLDNKLNLLLQMMGKILISQLELPEPVPVKMGNSSMEWTISKKKKLGETVGIPEQFENIRITLYLRPDYPFYVILPARVSSVIESGDEYQVYVDYQNLGDTMQDLLEQIIFRSHRRSVAFARHRN